MFRIRRIHDDVLPVNRSAIQEVKKILRERFPAAPAGDADTLEEKLRNPFRQKFRTVLLVAENARGRVQGFALLLHDPVLEFAYLDFIAAAPDVKGRGVGAALYERTRDESLSLGAHGLFFECLADEPEDCPDPVLRKENAARLRFYERYGARPLESGSYDLPVPGISPVNLPYLMFDGLDQGAVLRPRWVRKVVRAILERKYASLCPPEYVDAVVASFRDDPLVLRAPRYARRGKERAAATRRKETLAVVINDRHDIHHVRERGYVESPVRIASIRGELEAQGLLRVLPVRRYPLKCVTAVHAPDLVEYLRRSCASVPPGKSVYPYVFPIRNAARQPKELSVRAGYYCIDTFTPVNAQAYPAALRAVDCTLTAADTVLRGERCAYALVRPPGHHAERRSFGGFCYFNNAAVAAHHLSQHGRVAMVDVDYHHGNGQQEIFYRRADVLTVSLHGDPDFAYPYFTGFADERGEEEGAGFNLNLPLPERVDGVAYRRALARALRAVTEFSPDFLVVPLGLDTVRGDPTGSWNLTGKDLEENGRMLGELRLPTLIVQEGGYRIRTLGQNACHFLRGLMEASR